MGIINYLSIFSPSTASIYETLQKLTSSKAVCTWNATYQALYEKAKPLIKADACMMFYNETKLLHLETDVSGIVLGTSQLQTRNGTICPKILLQTTPY